MTKTIMLKNNGWVNNVVRDVNPNSNTYLTIVAQRVFDPSICPIPSTEPDWMLLGEYCSGDDNIKTYRDNNPLSATYMEMRQDIIEGGCAEPEKTEYIFQMNQLYNVFNGIVWSKWIRGDWADKWKGVYIGYYKDPEKEGTYDALSKDEIVANEVDFQWRNRWSMHQFTDTTKQLYLFASVEADSEEEAKRLFDDTRYDNHFDIYQYSNYEDEDKPRGEIYFINHLEWVIDLASLPAKTRTTQRSVIADDVEMFGPDEWTRLQAKYYYSYDNRFGSTVYLNNSHRLNNNSIYAPQPSDVKIKVGLYDMPIDTIDEAEAYYNQFMIDKEWIFDDNEEHQGIAVSLQKKRTLGTYYYNVDRIYGSGDVTINYQRGPWGDFKNLYIGYWNNPDEEGSYDAVDINDITVMPIDTSTGEAQTFQFEEGRNLFIFASAEAYDKYEAHTKIRYVYEEGGLSIDLSDGVYHLTNHIQQNYMIQTLTSRTRKKAIFTVDEGIRQKPQVTLDFERGNLMGLNATNNERQITYYQPSTCKITVGFADLPVNYKSEAEAYYNQFMEDKEWIVDDNYDTSNLEIILRFKQD